MSQDAAGGPTFELSLTCDNVIESAAGPPVRVLGPRIEKGLLRIAVVRDGEVELVSVRELLNQKAFASRHLAVDTNTGPREEVLTWVLESKRVEALEREAHLIDVLYGRSSVPGSPTGPYDAHTTTETERRKAKTQELGISAPTMTRRLQAYRGSGLAGLVPHASRALHASGALNVDPEILAVAKDFMANRVRASKKTLTNEYALLLDELRRRGLLTLHEGATTPDGRPVPLAEKALPYKKFVQLLRHLNQGRDPRTAKTRQQQSNRPAVTGYRHRALDFGDRIEMDSTPVDVFVQGANGPVRGHAVFAVCTSTRYLWVRVTPGAPRGRDLALLLWDMAGGESAFVADSTAGARRVPALPRTELSLNAWRGEGKPPASLPGCVVLDHGAEEENNRLIRYCAQLGISIRWARTREPTDKPYVESGILTFAQACQLVPGHKGNTIENRPSVDPERVPTVEMLQAAVAEWQQFHVNREHTGLPHPHSPGRFLTPLEAVHLSMTRGVPLRGLQDPTRALGLLEHTSLTPQDDGVTFRRRRYTCPDYQDVITGSLGRDGKRRKVTFYYDPNRPGRLYWPVPGGSHPCVLMSPEEAGEAILPFADLRDHWLAAVQGHKPATPNHQGSRTAALVGAVAEAMERADGDYENVISIQAAKKRHSSGPSAMAHTPSGGWDLTEAMDLLDDLGETAEEEW